MLTSHCYSWWRRTKVVTVLGTPAVSVEPGELSQEDLGLPKLVVVLVVESGHDEPSPVSVMGIVTDREVMPYDELDSWIWQINASL